MFSFFLSFFLSFVLPSFLSFFLSWQLCLFVCFFLSHQVFHLFLLSFVAWYRYSISKKEILFEVQWRLVKIAMVAGLFCVLRVCALLVVGKEKQRRGLGPLFFFCFFFFFFFDFIFSPPEKFLSSISLLEQNMEIFLLLKGREIVVLMNYLEKYPFSLFLLKANLVFFLILILSYPLALPSLFFLSLNSPLHLSLWFVFRLDPKRK